MVNRNSLWVFVVVGQLAVSRLVLAQAVEPPGVAPTPEVRRLIDALRDYPTTADIQELGTKGEAARPAVPTLIGVLKNGLQREEVRCAAAEALGSLASAGDTARSAVEPLIGVLDDVLEPEKVRCAAAQALGEFGSATEEAALMKTLRSDQPTALHSAAAAALAKMPPARTGLLEAMRDKSQPTDVRLIISEALGRMELARDQAFAAEALPDLLELLKDTTDAGDIRYAAARMAGNMGALDDLRTLFQDKDAGTCFGAAVGLARIARQDSEALDVLQHAFEGGDWWLRYSAAEALAEMGPTAAPATPKLATRLGDEDVWVRYAAAKALARIGQAALDELENACATHKPPKVRHAAAQALRMMVGVMVTKWEEVEKAFKLDTADGRKHAAAAAKAWKTKEAERLKRLPELLEKLGVEEGKEMEPDPQVRKAAREALRQLDRLENELERQAATTR